MLKQKFIKLSEDLDFYEHFLEYFDGEDVKAKSHFDYYLEQFLDKINKLQLVPEGIVVWRMINASSLDSINTQNIGGSWTYSQKSAHSWYGGDGQSFLIEGIIPIESIDLETTLRQNLVNPDEEEFRLESNSIVFISKIMNYNKEIIKEFNPPKVSSSGKIGIVGDWIG